MSRTVNASNLTETQASKLIPAMFLQIEFTGGFLYIWTGVGTVTWGGNDYVGTGHFLELTSVTETAEIKAAGITASLTGIPSSLLSAVLGESRQGKTVKMYLGFFNSSLALVATPELVFDGRLDVPVIQESGDTATITISAESRLIDLERVKVRRYTDRDQQNRYSGDLGLQYVESLQTKKLLWGAGGNGGGPSGKADSTGFVHPLNRPG